MAARLVRCLSKIASGNGPSKASVQARIGSRMKCKVCKNFSIAQRRRASCESFGISAMIAAMFMFSCPETTLCLYDFSHFRIRGIAQRRILRFSLEKSDIPPNFFLALH